MLAHTARVTLGIGHAGYLKSWKGALETGIFGGLTTGECKTGQRKTSPCAAVTEIQQK